MQAYRSERNVIIHVGLPKAASTYIKRAYLRRMSAAVLIPRGNLLTELSRTPFDDVEFGSKINRVINPGGASDEPLIITNEGLSGGFFDCKSTAVIAANLGRVFPSAKILLILREQFDYIRSVYAFLLSKGYRMPPFERFVEVNELSFLDKLSYDKLIQIYRDTFEQILVLPVELLRVNHSKFETQIIEFTGAALRYPVGDIKENRSVNGARRLNVLRWLNQIFWPVTALERGLKRRVFGNHASLRSSGELASFQQLVTASIERIIRSDSTELTLPFIIIERMKKHFGRSNSACQKLTGLDLGELGYAVAPSDQNEVCALRN